MFLGSFENELRISGTAFDFLTEVGTEFLEVI
jgi:hypothetical protein